VTVRYISIDLLRASAMVIMVIVHFCENLAGYTPLIAGLGAPMFMFLSGVSYRLWLNGQLKRDRNETEITKISVRRGLFLFALGFAFNILVWSPEDAFNWDILTLIGTGLIVLSFSRNLPLPVMLIFVACISLIAPISARLADWPAFWTEGHFDPDPTYSDVLLGFIATGYFPIIPWIAFPVLGFATATLLFNLTPSRDLSFNLQHAANFSKTGLSLMAISLILIGSRYVAPSEWLKDLPETWTMFPPSLEYLLAIMGFTLFAFVNLFRWIDHAPKDHRKLQNLVGSFSKYSLSFYLLHHIAHLWPLWIYGVIWGEHPHDYWEKATSVPVALALAGVFLVASFIFFRFVERYKWPTAEALMRWLCD
jgi:uncharacterized membrane protein